MTLERPDFQRLLFRTAFCVMVCDGEPHDKEKDEIKAIEDKKHAMIEILMADHLVEFSDIKNYYNDITHNNLDLIKSLKEEVKELESDERNDQIRLREKMAENKKLTAPLKKMQEDLIRLKN